METLNMVLNGILEQQGRIEVKLDHALERMGLIESNYAADHEKITFCNWVITATLIGVVGMAFTLIWTHVTKGVI